MIDNSTNHFEKYQKNRARVEQTEKKALRVKNVGGVEEGKVESHLVANAKTGKKELENIKKGKQENKIEYKLIKYMTLYLINDLVTRSNNRTNTILCARFSR